MQISEKGEINNGKATSCPFQKQIFFFNSNNKYKNLIVDNLLLDSSFSKNIFYKFRWVSKIPTILDFYKKYTFWFEFEIYYTDF